MLTSNHLLGLSHRLDAIFKYNKAKDKPEMMGKFDADEDLIWDLQSVLSMVEDAETDVEIREKYYNFPTEADSGDKSGG